jgi:AraC-like DNA-binding protein
MPSALYDGLDTHQFGHTLTGALAPVAVRASDGFSAQVWHASSGTHSVSRIVAAAHRAEGRGRAGRDHLACSFLVAGSAVVEQAGRRHVVRPGDAWWFRTGADYVLTFESDVELIGIGTSPQRVPIMGASVTGIADGGDPTLAALFTAVGGLAQGVDAAPPHIQSRILDHLLDIVETISRRAVLERLGSFGRGPAIFAEALDHIDAALAEPGLSPRSIAAALHVSVRTLHSAFAPAGASVSETIRGKRLERCRQDLADPAFGSWRVSDIGSRWGFVSHSHFTAAFREAYGATPSAFREAGRAD